MVRVIQRQWVVLEEREGGLLPGSPEAVAAIERVRRMLNPETARPATPPAWSIKEPDSPEFRTCEKCGAAVRGKNRCKPCMAEATRNAHLERARVKHLKPRICEVCRADITGYGSRSIRCTVCQKQHEYEVLKAKNAKRTPQPVGPDAVLSRPCKRCNGPVIGKRFNASYCTDCARAIEAESTKVHRKRQCELRKVQRRVARAEREAAKPRRYCACGADITAKKPEAVRCDECKRKAKSESSRRSKERRQQQGASA